MGIDIEELSRRSSWAPEQVEELKASRLDLHTVDAERLGAAAMALVDAGYLTAGARACLRLLAAPRIHVAPAPHRGQRPWPGIGPDPVGHLVDEIHGGDRVGRLLPDLEDPLHHVPPAEQDPPHVLRKAGIAATKSSTTIRPSASRCRRTKWSMKLVISCSPAATIWPKR